MQCYTCKSAFYCLIDHFRPFVNEQHFFLRTKLDTVQKKGPKEIYFDKMLSVSYARVAWDKKTSNERKTFPVE